MAPVLSISTSELPIASEITPSGPGRGKLTYMTLLAVEKTQLERLTRHDRDERIREDPSWCMLVPFAHLDLKGIEEAERKVRRAHPILFRVAGSILFVRDPFEWTRTRLVRWRMGYRGKRPP